MMVCYFCKNESVDYMELVNYKNEHVGFICERCIEKIKNYTEEGEVA